MAFFVGKAHDLIFDRWAIAWADAFDHARKERRTMDVIANDLMGFGCRMHQIAGQLRAPAVKHRRSDRADSAAACRNAGIGGVLRPRRTRNVRDVCCQAAIRAALKSIVRRVDPWRRAGLQPMQREAKAAQSSPSATDADFTGTSGRPLRIAGDRATAQKGAGCQHQRPPKKLPAGMGLDGETRWPVADPPGSIRSCLLRGWIERHDALDHRLFEVKARSGFEQFLHILRIQSLVGLSAERLDRRAFGIVEHPNLDHRRIGDTAHHAAKRIDLADDMAFGRPADRRIARHMRDFVEVDRQQQRRAPMRAAAQAASHPAWPAPTTITS